MCYSAPMTETIFTKHPGKGRSGREISRQKYDVMRIAITEVLALKGELTHDELVDAVTERLQKSRFMGDIPWYAETVKLDLEARKIIQRVKSDKKDKYKLWPELKI